SGVVLGSEIMKKVKSRSAPFATRCRGMASGSPSHTDRPNTSDRYTARNAYVTSLLVARFTTRPPPHAMKNANTTPVPHWPGETHARSVTIRRATRAMFVGLNRCFRPSDTTNLLAMATTAAAASIHQWLVRRSRQSESAEIIALRGSKRGSRQTRVQTYC